MNNTFNKLNCVFIFVKRLKKLKVLNVEMKNISFNFLYKNVKK